MKISGNLAISDSGFLFNPSTGESFTANPVGTEIIRMLKDGLSEKEIIAEFTQKYSVDAVVISKDLNDFTEILRHHQLLEKDEETSY